MAAFAVLSVFQKLFLDSTFSMGLRIYFLKVKTKRNVRFAELERLKKESDYFSYAKMREREPLLFDRMIGRFLPEEGL